MGHYVQSSISDNCLAILINVLIVQREHEQVDAWIIMYFLQNVIGKLRGTRLVHYANVVRKFTEGRSGGVGSIVVVFTSVNSEYGTVWCDMMSS